MKIDIKKKSYHKRIIIQDLHFELPTGSTLILGTSGAGKSTFIRCLTGQAKYDGKIRCAGEWPKMAYIPQHLALNKGETVFQSIYYSGRFDELGGDVAEMRRRTLYYIKMLGLEYVQNNRINQLSGGQQQRVAIATELIRNANFIIADELDTGLDAGVAFCLARDMQRIAHDGECTVLVISHNASNAYLYDRLLVLAKGDNNIGGVAFFGRPDEALDYFNVKNFAQILIEVNSEAEGGKGLGPHYINAFKNYKGPVTRHTGAFTPTNLPTASGNDYFYYGTM